MPEVPHFVTSSGANPSGLYWALAMLNAIEQRNETVARGLLSPPISPEPLLYWQPNSDEIPPGWMIGQQGSVRVVGVRGTHFQWAPWLSHLRGSIGSGTDLTDRAMVATFFDRAAKEFWDFVKFKVGDPMPYQWRLVGHSFGAGIVFLMALRMLKEFPDITLEGCTYGEPRVVSNLYDGKVPELWARVAHEFDVVCELPPAYLTWLAVLSPLSSSVTWLSRIVGGGGLASQAIEEWAPRKWQHYTLGTRIYESGELRSFADISFIEQAALISPTPGLWLTSHLVNDGYAKAILSNWRSRGSPIEDKATTDVIRQFAGITPGPPTTWQPIPFTPEEEASMREVLGWSEGGPSSAELYAAGAGTGSVSVTNPGDSGSNGSFGGSGMASGIWDVTLVISNDLYSKTFTVSTLGEDITSVYNKALVLAANRANLLGRDQVLSPGGVSAAPSGRGTPAIEYILIRDAKDPRFGQPFNVPRETGNPSPGVLAGSGADPLWMDLSFPLYGASGATRKRRTLLIYGNPDGIISGGVYVGKSWSFGPDTAAPRAFNDRLRVFLLYLTSGTGGWGISGQDDTILPQAIESWEVQPDGKIQATLNVAHGLVTGDIIRVRGTKSRYLNRRWTVRKVDAFTLELLNSVRAASQVPTTPGSLIQIGKQNGQRLVKFYPFVAFPGGSAMDPASFLTVGRSKPGRRFRRTSFGQRGRLNS